MEQSVEEEAGQQERKKSVGAVKQKFQTAMSLVTILVNAVPLMRDRATGTV